MAKVTITAEEAKKLSEENFDWEAFDTLTDEENHQAALDDPDAQPLTEERLKQFKPAVHRGNGVYAHEKKDTGAEQKTRTGDSGQRKEQNSG